MLSAVFSVGGSYSLFTDRASGRKALEIVYEGDLRVRLWYSFSDEPLTLSAKADPGENVKIVIRPCKIGLYANGRLCDEEWPCGVPLLSVDSLPEGDIRVSLTAIDEPEPESGIRGLCPRSGIGAEQIRLPGVNIGDCMPFSDSDGDGRYHLFYLYDRHHHASKWGLGAHQWAHVSTKDLRLWDEHPMAVGITEDFEGSICTGSVCRAVDESGKRGYYAWYAVRMSDRSPARMTFAYSDDLIHFKKCGSYFTMPGSYEQTSARDPKVFYLNGKYHMLITTSRLSDGSGCLAHLTNDKMAIDGWEDNGTVMAWADITSKDDPTRLWQPECPDFFRIGRYYYLVFGIGGSSRYGYSESPFDGYIYPEDNIIPCGSVPKSALLPSDGRLIFCGFIGEGGYGGRLAALEARALPDGKLIFSDVIPTEKEISVK